MQFREAELFASMAKIKGYWIFFPKVATLILAFQVILQPLFYLFALFSILIPLYNVPLAVFPLLQHTRQWLVSVLFPQFQSPQSPQTGCMVYVVGCHSWECQLGFPRLPTLNIFDIFDHRKWILLGVPNSNVMDRVQKFLHLQIQIDLKFTNRVFFKQKRS